MKAKLILVEGLPGSGKTTTAQIVTELLRSKGFKVKLYLEGNLDHPADYESMAYLSEEEYQDLLEQHSSFSSLLERHAYKQNNGRVLPYQKVKKEAGNALPQLLFERLASLDIYELPINQNKELITNRWEAFRDQSLYDESIYVFECCFIQNPITMTMVKENCPEDVSFGYIAKLAEIIKPLDPFLIYVNQDDVGAAFRKAIKERSKAWSDFSVSYYTEQGFGLAQHCVGVDGAIEVLKARKDLELRIIWQLPLNYVEINNSKFHSESHKTKLLEVLENFF